MFKTVYHLIGRKWKNGHFGVKLKKLCIRRGNEIQAGFEIPRTYVKRSTYLPGDDEMFTHVSGSKGNR